MKMTQNKKQVLYDAFIQKDASYEGLFFVGVKTTGIVCRVICSAKKAHLDNIEFFSSYNEALSYGYRPCKVCKPDKDQEVPESILLAMNLLEQSGQEKVSDQQLKESGIEPSYVRRWFMKKYHMTFHAYQRAVHISGAVQSLPSCTTIPDIAYESGYQSLSGFAYTYKKKTRKSPKSLVEKPIIYMHQIQTPLGEMLAMANDEGLCFLEFAKSIKQEAYIESIERNWQVVVLQGKNEYLKQTEKELVAYFAGSIKIFTIPLILYGTEFQKRVWTYLQTIPYANTISYQEEAHAIGIENAQRAVANANGKNHIAIIIPCHRVIGKDNTLHGYAAGVWRKQWLLEHEMKYSLRQENI